MVIRTSKTEHPISIRDFDWKAVDESQNAPMRGIIGYGSSEQEAIVDLLQQLAQSGTYEEML